MHEPRATAASVKSNQPLRPDCAEYRRATMLVEAVLGGNRISQSAALPRIVSAPLFARYKAGMGYGPHLDNALMRGSAIRTHLAWTLFVYPATSRHRVEAVTSGRREACVG